MNVIERAVSIHPYFNVRPGGMAAAKAILQEFTARTAREDRVLFYEFTLNGDQVFCREAYVGADGLLAHLKNVGEVLEKFLAIADLARLEVHGPAEELEKLKGPLGHLNPTWFVYECGVTRKPGA
jgi:hypothetical protein